MPAVFGKAEWHTDSAARIRRMMAQAELQLRDSFLRAVSFIRDKQTLQYLEGLIIAGRIEEAVTVAGQAFSVFSQDYITVFVRSGQETAAFLTKELQVIHAFDQSNLRAVAMMQQNRLRLIREFTNAQRLATREALLDGIMRGLNPRQQAVAFRNSIGLTANQQGAVSNFRRMLIEGDSTVFTRKLRDRRFDRTIRRTFAAEESLTTGQVEKMTTRYREKFLRHRSETLARTESLRSVHEGVDEMYDQAIEEGSVAPDDIQGMWNTARDDRVRDPETGADTSHRTMHGQIRPMGVPFISGAGAQLMRPGDLSAPGEETIMCRCVITRRFKAAGSAAAA